MKNVILYLVRSTEKDVDLFLDSLSSINENLVPYINNFDILCMHEPDFIKFKTKIEEKSPLSIKFHELPDFTKLPTYYDTIKIEPDYHGYGMGYRHMCRFYSGTIFGLDILKQYKYYLRLDNDSTFPKKVEKDLFKEMEESGAWYGYIENSIRTDPDWCAEGIQGIVKEYLVSNNIPTSIDIGSITTNRIYYNNFEICLVEWFNSERYQNYFRHVDMSGKIMTNRFGDALVRYFGVNYLMPKERIKSFNICYKHFGVING